MTTTTASAHAALTDTEADRLYLDWHERVCSQVRDAIALATGVREETAAAFHALQRDLTAIDLTRRPPAPSAYEYGSTGERAATAQTFLRSAERYYAGRNPTYALQLLQSAAITARAVLTDLGWQPAS
jgi:hypothetical protein